MIKLVNSPTKFRVFGVAQTNNIFSLNTVPVNLNGSGGAYELGVRFQSKVPGQLIGISFYKVATDTAIHLGKLWTNNGILINSVTFVNETTSGWQTQYFSNPIHLLPNVFYCASVNSTKDAYAYAPQYFNTVQQLNNLYIPIAAGVYVEGVDNFPNKTFNNNNYYRDLIFVPS